MKKHGMGFLPTALAAAAVLIFGGCQNSFDPSRIFIGIAIPETHVNRWIKDGNALRSEAMRRGYRAVAQFADGNQATQNKQIETFLNFNAKLLIVCPVDETVAPAIAAAAAANVPVIAYDRLITNSDDYDYFITFNNFKVGILQAEFIVGALGLRTVTAEAPKTITLFAGAPTDANTFFFYDGAMSVLNPHIERGALKVIGPYARTSEDRENFMKIATERWLGTTAGARMAEFLTNEAADVVLDAVLAPNDHLARAIIAACKTDPKYREKLPVIIGQDAEFESVFSIKNGEQSATIFKDISRLSEAAVALADRVLKGESTDIPGVTLAVGYEERIGNTGKKTVRTFLLDPVLITRDNIRIPVRAGFYTPAESAALLE